jgi:S1-C subfamily serine protease
VIRARRRGATLSVMTNFSLATFSTGLADIASAAAPAVVQVMGARRPATGVIHGPDTIVTTARAIGREDGLRIRVGDSEPAPAALVGWDPSTGIAVLRSENALTPPAPAAARAEPRPGEIVLAIARSWSGAVTVSAGVVAVVGGPLRTGRRAQIARVIRVSAPMHDGFAGGAVYDMSGTLTGIATASPIRGFGIAIPAAIAWEAADRIVRGGTPRRGFLGLAVQPTALTPAPRGSGGERALLVVGVTPDSPAAAAGLIVGDILLELDGHTTGSPDDLLDLLAGDRVGKTVRMRTLRGGSPRDVPVTIGERPQN